MRARVLPALCLILFLGCTASTQRKLIVSLNEAQEVLATTYDDAKAKETVASKTCADALKRAGVTPPSKPEAVKPMCDAIGSPLPYDPVKLRRAAGPVNGLYDLVRAANEQRTAGADKDTVRATFVRLSGLLASVISDLTEAGLAIPEKVRQASTDLQTALKENP